MNKWNRAASNRLEQEISSTNGLLSFLASNKKELDRMILDFLPVKSRNKEISSLYTMMRDYPSRGGKGFRGSLCLSWCQLFGGKREDALSTAAALELFQNWILIHDDIEDESDLRRGQPALHKKYGVPLAINAGDALHGKMWELLLSKEATLGEAITFQILKEFSTMLNETTEGQQMELAWGQQNNWEITEPDYLMMVAKKSAWYTCTSPSRMGVILASSASNIFPKDLERVLEQIVRMGTDMGIAFQIVDDILNLTAAQEKYGKEILGDIFEGKRTLMLIHLLSNCGKSEADRILSTLSKPRQEKRLGEVKRIFELMQKKGSLEYAKHVADAHSKSGLALYDSICGRNGLKLRVWNNSTRQLLEYLVSRDY
jgi:geranylgeranyl diphosphate synthase type II